MYRAWWRPAGILAVGGKSSVLGNRLLFQLLENPKVPWRHKYCEMALERAMIVCCDGLRVVSAIGVEYSTG